MARAWIPLDTWWGDFLAAYAQRLDSTNWLAARTHLRRVAVLHCTAPIAPGQFGRVCVKNDRAT